MRYSTRRLQTFIQWNHYPSCGPDAAGSLIVGRDSDGKPFRRRRARRNGARLEDVSFLQAGVVIGVQHANHKARFRVAWAGQIGTAEEGQIGIVSVEPGKCIWWQALTPLSAKRYLEDLHTEPEPCDVLSNARTSGPDTGWENKNPWMKSQSNSRIISN